MAAPKRDVFKAADVCDVAQLQPYVLRSWEAEFPQIGQATGGGGPRVYRKADIDLVLRIKHLVFEEGLTLSGARRRLEEEGEAASPQPVLAQDPTGLDVRHQLKSVREGLQSILHMLSNGDAEPELHLVAPPAAKKKVASKPKGKK
jgi:DNA-binding transcriptional MerR regulator